MNKQIQALMKQVPLGKTKRRKNVKYNNISKSINKKLIIVYIGQDKTGDKLF